MAERIISITIKDANWDLVRNAVLDKYPKENGYTNEQWIKIVMRKCLKRIVQEYSEKIVMATADMEANAIKDAAKASINVPDNITE